MAHFVEQYAHAIQRYDDYNSLTNEINICISRNVLNFVSTDIKDAIDRLGINTPYYNFIKIMVWAATVSDHTETSLNLLKYFCNKVTKEFDSLTLEPDEFSLMVIVICAEDKQFINKLTKDRKLELINTLCKEYLVLSENYNNFDVKQYLLTSMDLILQGKTMQELDQHFKDYYNDITSSKGNHIFEKDGTGRIGHYVINEIGRPFQALFINIMQNINQEKFLYDISVNEWTNRIENTVKIKAIFYEKKLNNKEYNMNYTGKYYMVMKDFIFGFSSLNEELTKTGFNNITNVVVGRYLWLFLEHLHQYYSYTDLRIDEIVFLIKDARQIFFDNFAVTDLAKNIINITVDAYCDSGEYEDIFFQHDYFEAIKAYLNQDELFNIWKLDSRDNSTYGISNSVYATYIHEYMNPILTKADTYLKDVATEAKSEQWQMDDEEDEEEDNQYNENKKSDVEIKATQSTKGYKKSSKIQADSERKIYKAYKKYKNNEEKVDSQLSKMLVSAKKAFSQDKTEEIIEGKRFTPIGLLKKIIKTSAIFSYSKIAGFAYLLTSHTLSKKRTEKQKREILIEIESEIKMLDEKIEDARSDGNRQAKYSLMRTRTELIRARDKIKYNLTATKEDMKTARNVLNRKNRDDE